MVMFGTKGATSQQNTPEPQTQPALGKPRAIKDAATLLKPQRYQIQLERIKALAHVPDYYYQHFYVPAIEQVAEFVQSLPAARIQKFNKADGLLDFSLRRTAATLDWYRREYPIRQQSPEKVSPDDAKMTWALFSAGLILGLGYIPTQYWVSLCQEDGTFLCRWQPLLGNMRAQGQWYRCGIEPAFDNLAHRTTLLLTDMLLPREALAWLSSSRDLFNAWLALLAGDLVDGGLFAKFVMPAEWQLLEHARLHYESDMPPSLLPSLNEFEKPAQKEENLALTAEDSEIPTALQTETAPLTTQSLSISALAAIKSDELSGALGAAETGAAFIEWLRQAINVRADGTRAAKISVNSPDALVHMSQEGVQLFLGRLAKLANMNPATILAGLNELKIPYHNASGGRLIVNDPTVLFPNTIPGYSAYVQSDPGPAYPTISTEKAAHIVQHDPKPLMR